MGWETGGKESWSVKDGSKVPGLMRRLESRRAPNRVLAWDILHFFTVIISNTGGVVRGSVMGCGELGGSQEELLRCMEPDISSRPGSL